MSPGSEQGQVDAVPDKEARSPDCAQRNPGFTSNALAALSDERPYRDSIHPMGFAHSALFVDNGYPLHSP